MLNLNHKTCSLTRAEKAEGKYFEDLMVEVQNIVFRFDQHTIHHYKATMLKLNINHKTY